MNRRNFKVRIKNLNLKETFSLEYAENGYLVYSKYEKLMTKQGFSMVDHFPSGKNTTTYVYYPIDLEIKHRKEIRATRRRFTSGRPRPRGLTRTSPRKLGTFRRVSWRKPEFEVRVEITTLIPTPKFKT